MIKDINTSGVVFTKELNTGSFYYVINYDDITGLSNSVTSGSGKFSNRTVLISKTNKQYIKSKRFNNLINSIKEIERVYKNENLDIEFIINKKLKIYILQARYLSTPILSKRIENKINKNQKMIFKNINRKIKNYDINLYGNKTIFAQMPDWNPAEIIGKYPNRLSQSLYKELITNKVWLHARDLMGYKSNFKEKALMYIFCGQPFIDVRKSFNSFLPKTVTKKFGDKLINHWINKLYKNPELHDKVEFEIVTNSYFFDFVKNFNFLNHNSFSKKIVEMLHDGHKKIFNNVIKPDHPGSLEFNLKLVTELHGRMQKYPKNKFLKISDIKNIIEDTKKFGTLPFSILARHGFIAISLLNSMLRLKILNNNEKENFLESIKTITGEFLKDCKKLKSKDLSFSNFKKIWSFATRNI